MRAPLQSHHLAEHMKTNHWITSFHSALDITGPDLCLPDPAGRVQEGCGEPRQPGCFPWPSSLLGATKKIVQEFSVDT